MVRFWDSSAVIPLLLDEPRTADMLAILREDDHMFVWWGTRIECVSALTRRTREGALAQKEETKARTILSALIDSWSETQPTNAVRTRAERLLATHPLRAADAFQLAAALAWSDPEQGPRVFVCLDSRLRTAAQKEGFRIEPAI